MPTHLVRSSLTVAELSLMPTGHFSPPVSTRHSRHPSPTPSLVPLSNSYWRSPAYCRSRRDLESKPLVGFRAKTGKGIICFADHLHSVTRVLKYSLKNKILWDNITKTNRFLDEMLNIIFKKIFFLAFFKMYICISAWELYNDELFFFFFFFFFYCWFNPQQSYLCAYVSLFVRACVYRCVCVYVYVTETPVTFATNFFYDKTDKEKI